MKSTSPTPVTPSPALLTTEQAAAYLNISPATLMTWRSTKRNIIPYIKLGGKNVRYKLADLDSYINSLPVTA